MNNDSFKQLLKEYKKTILEEEYKLDSKLIKRINGPMSKTWRIIGNYPMAIDVKTNVGAIKIIIDADRLAYYDREANVIIHDVIKKYGHKKVLNFLSKNIQLI